MKFSAMLVDIVGESETSIDMKGERVEDLIGVLVERCGEEFEKRVIDEETGELRRFINVFVNGRDIRNLESLDTHLNNENEIRIMPSVAGGKEEFGFSEDQIRRYSRQIVLPEVGGKGQRKLLDSSVLIVGAGGLGSPAALYLAAAGAGKIGLIDDDKVELSNIQRQLLHTTEDVGKPKTQSAEEGIKKVNPDVEVVKVDEKLAVDNVFKVLEGWDVVLDGSDNFPTKYLLNDACVMEKTPLSHGGVLRFTGIVTTIIPMAGPCYRCLSPEAPPPGAVPSCQEAGVLGTVPGIIGTIQANEVIRYLLDTGELLVGRGLHLNARNMSFDEFKFKHNPDCPSCGEEPKITDLSKVDYGHRCEVGF